jgi:serine/threonine-protein kinase SRPK3
MSSDSDYDSNEDSEEMSSDDIDFSTNGDHLTNKVLNNRYLLLKKIGYGSFSSVWLTMDWNDKKYYALKIYNDDDYEEGIGEIKILKIIKKLGSKYLMSMIDYFIYEIKINRKNNKTKKEELIKNRHPCIVFELMAGSLYDVGKYHYEKNGIPIELIEKIYPQITEGILLLHKKLEIIHGDIKPENILVKGYSYEIAQYINCVNELHLDLLYNEVKSLEELCKYSSDKIDNLEINDDIFIEQKYLDNIEICITDFGSTIHRKNFSSDEIQTRYYRSPEILLQLKHGYPCDIWAIGCMLFEIITGKILFNPEKDDIRDRDYHHLLLITKYIGRIPKFMIDSSPKKREYYLKYNLKHDQNVVQEKYILNELSKKISDQNKLNSFVNLIMNILNIEINKRNLSINSNNI